MSEVVQLELIEEPIYKVRWKAYEEDYEWDNRTFSRRFTGFTDKIITKTTIGFFTMTGARSFAEFVSTQLNEYAGWHEIIKVR